MFKMINIVKEAFSLHLFVLRIVGLMPIINFKILSVIYAVIIYCFITVPLPILSVACYFSGNFDLNKVTESAFITAEFVLEVFKFLPFILNGQKIYAIVQILEQPIFSNNFKERQKQIINNCNNTCKRCLWFCLTNVAFAIPFYVSLPMISTIQTLPTEICLPFDNSPGTLLYIFSYIYVSLGCTVEALATAAYDTFVSGLVFQATAQIRILKDNLTNLEQDTEEDIIKYYPNSIKDTNLKDVIIFNKIKKCAVHHQHILNFVACYEQYFTSGVFAQFLGGCFVICISVFELTIVQPFSIVFYFAVSFTTQVLFQLFLYCYFGTTLQEESRNISTAIYMGNWYNYNQESKKLLLILMEKANRPLVVTAGAVLDLSLSTFTMIIRRAYSFYAVLKQYQ